MTRPEIDFRAMAGLLRAGWRASMAGHAGAVVAAMGILHQGPEPAYLLGLAAWGGLIYLQIRVGLDVELFLCLADGANGNDVDAFLIRSGLLRKARERTWEDRIRGAMSLWRKLLGVLVIQLVAVAVGLLW